MNSNQLWEIVQVKGQIFLSGQFLNQKGKIRVLQAYDNAIQISNKSIPLCFETKFQLLREPVEEKYKLGKPLGLLFEREGVEKKLKLFSDDEQLLLQFKDFLAKRINQRGFHESFRAQRKIGRGNFASVYLADRLEDERSFAIKAFSKEVAFNQDKGRMSILNEIRVMRQLDCNALIKLHEVYETENSLYMVLDLLEGGSLYDKIKHKPQFNGQEIELLIYTLLEGLQAMHSKQIMHRDLKPENILFRKLNILQSVCIADFGLAQISTEYPFIFNRCGTPGFVAPEVVNCKDGSRYGLECDIFSLGLIFYILLTGKPAFPGKSYNDVLAKNRKCDVNLDPAFFENVSKQAYDLLRKMLEKDPSKRISASQALTHQYFQKRQKEQKQQKEQKEGMDEQQYLKQIEYQLDSALLNSPILTASHSLAKNNSNDSLYQQSPLLNGRTDQIENSPLPSAGFNSPSAKPNHRFEFQSKPSRFKESDGNNTPGGDQNSTTRQARTKQFSLNQNPLHKYAIRNEIQRQQQEQKKDN